MSSDKEESRCQVYADVNKDTPMRYASAAGAGCSEELFRNGLLNMTEIIN
jgi:hypothetical protein